MRRMWTAAGSMMLALLVGGCAVYDPQSHFQKLYRSTALPSSAADPGEVAVQWFGTSTLLFRDADQAIMIDGFFSRPNTWRTALNNLAPDPEAVSEALHRARASPIAEVFVIHAHHDHAQDAPALARVKNATLYGSRSILNLVRGYDVPEEQLRLIRPNVAREVVGFQVTAVPTPHAESKFPSAEIDEVYPFPLHALGFSAGTNYSFIVRRGAMSALLVPSAGYEPVGNGDTFGAERVGLVFLGIGSLGKREASFICGFGEASVRQRGAQRVVLIHWDAFTHGLDKPRPFSRPFDDVDRAYRLLKQLAKADDVKLGFIKPYEPVNLTALAAFPRETVSVPRDCRIERIEG